MELVELIEKDSAFSSCKLPAVRAQLLQCHGDQLVLLFSKMATFILLKEMSQVEREKILQITLPHAPCHESNAQFVALSEECEYAYSKIKGDLDQAVSDALEKSHKLKTLFTQVKSDYDEMKLQVESLESQLLKKFGTLEEEKLQEYMEDLRHQVVQKQEYIRELMDDDDSLTSFTQDSSTSSEIFGDSFSLLDTWKNLVSTKAKLSERLKSGEFFTCYCCFLFPYPEYEWLCTHNIRCRKFSFFGGIASIKSKS